MDGDNEKHEIAIVAESLNRTYPQICGTILHEMVHLFNVYNGIKDTTNNCIYHNKKFKQIAEQYGLDVTKDKHYGWAFTKLNEQNLKLIESFGLNTNDFKIFKKIFKKDVIDKKIMYKHFCKTCNISFVLTKELNLICGNCNNTFEVTEKVFRDSNDEG
jgi:hypothetical protein